MVDLARNPTRSVRIGRLHHRRRTSDRRAEHDGDADAGCGGHGRPGARFGSAPAPMSCESLSITGKMPRRWRRFASKPRRIWRSICRRIIGWSTDVAPHVDKVRYNPGHLYHHEREKPWQEKVKFIVDAAAATRLRDSHWRELRQRRSGQEGKVRSGRFDHADAGKRVGALRTARFARLHAVLRIAEGLRSARR